MSPKAPFRLLYNNDTGNTAGLPSPWHEEGEPFGERMLVASIEEVAGRGVDAYMLSPGMGWVPWWQSDVEPDFYEWWRERTGLEVEGVRNLGYDTYVSRGGDMVKVLVDTCRRFAMAPFVSLRLNDVHHQENYIRKNQESLVSCRFYVEHPEWHIDRDHPQKEGYYKRRGMDWAVEEVRRYKLSLLRELADNYDLAGLELDFLRDDTLFRDDGPTDDERIAIVTEFVASVRAALDRKGGARRWLCVRIPQELSAHPRIGLDVRRLRDAGVDMFNLSGWIHTCQRTDLAAVRDALPEAAIYHEMTPSTAHYEHFLKPGKYGVIGNPRACDHQFYTTALLAHRRGADGLSLFNFVYYRKGRTQDVPVTEPPFHVLPRLNDVDFLSRQGAYFMIGKTTYFKQLPRTFVPGEPVRLTMDMYPPARLEPASESDAERQAGRLRIHTETPLAEGQSLKVRFNGIPLDACPDTTRFYGNPYDPMIGPAENRRAWYLPAALIKDGLNELEAVFEGGREIDAIFVDVGVSG